MVRVILILLAFYSVALSCIPCQDDAEAEAHDVASSVTATRQNHPLEMDLCSPFCVCACCAGITLQQEIASAPFISPFILFQEVTFAYLSGTNSDDLASIWQPPRI